VAATEEGNEEEGFDFDHAFRKFQSYLEKQQPDRLSERMGVALGAEEEGEEEEAEIKMMPEHQFLRKSGEYPDQQAVETKGLRQFASIRRKDTVEPEFYKKSDRVPHKADRAPQKTERMSYKEERAPHKSERTSYKEDRTSYKAEDKYKVKMDMSHYAKEHRGNHIMGQVNPYQDMAEKARSLIVLATNNALQSTTIATYLTQMWLSNVFQTIGFTILGALFGANNGRSFPDPALLMSADASTVDRLEAVPNLDFKSITAMIRDFADMADHFTDEL